MNRVTHILVWLSRIHRCRGFGIQSPTDYGFVRYVVNEHWPYYAYEQLGKGDGWLRRKLGRLYFRLANWRQPTAMADDDFRTYWQAGCRSMRMGGETAHVELARVDMAGDYRAAMERLYGLVDERSVIVVEGIWRDRSFWQEVVADQRTGVTFDLYYCGIVMFDRSRYKQNYIVNF